jgi:hypothetical protein
MIKLNTIKEIFLDLYYRIYLCLIFLKECFVVLIQKNFITPFQKKDIKRVRLSPLQEPINRIG